MFPPPTPSSHPPLSPSLVWENPCWSTKGLCVIAGEARSNVTAATIFAASRPAVKRRLAPTRTSVKWSSAHRDTNETTLCDVAGLSGSLGRLSLMPPSLSVSLKEGAGMLLTCSGRITGSAHMGRELGAVGCVKSPPSGSAWIWQEPCQRCCPLHAEWRRKKAYNVATICRMRVVVGVYMNDVAAN